MIKSLECVGLCYQSAILVNGQNPHCQAISSDRCMASPAAVRLKAAVAVLLVLLGRPFGTRMSPHAALCSDSSPRLIAAIRS